MRTCTSCRSKVEEDEGTLNAAGKFICSECAQDERLNAEDETAECPECGEPVEDKKAESCAACGAELEPAEEDEEA